MVRRDEIHFRDPFLFPLPIDRTYYLFGTTDPDPWKSKGTGFDVYTSGDLENWEGPYPAFRPPTGFWAEKNFWAPEVHIYKDNFYMFASFYADGRRRGTQILQASCPIGPYLRHSQGPVTPGDWECLDGTFYLDENLTPWMIFSHEWVQANDGEICAVQLSRDLRKAVGEALVLFKASEAGWTKGIRRRDGSACEDARVTDGPFVYRMSDNTLLILWSSISEGGYAMGYARSRSGTLLGPWDQSEAPIIDCDGGHGMIFKSFEGRLYLCYHSPNTTPEERFHYTEIIEHEAGLARIRGKAH